MPSLWLCLTQGALTCVVRALHKHRGLGKGSFVISVLWGETEAQEGLGLGFQRKWLGFLITPGVASRGFRFNLAFLAQCERSCQLVQSKAGGVTNRGWGGF